MKVCLEGFDSLEKLMKEGYDFQNELVDLL